MDKAPTDRAINRWILRFVFGPASVLSLLAFAIGYLYPDVVAAFQPVARRLGIHWLVAGRVVGTEFQAAAYSYWIGFLLTLPLNLLWLHRIAMAERVPQALRAIERTNLTSRVHDPAKYTLLRGYVTWVASAAVFGALFIVQLVVAHEPSYCKGCETSSVPGFVIINWGMTHMLLVATYIACSKTVSWKSVRTGIGA